MASWLPQSRGKANSGAAEERLILAKTSSICDHVILKRNLGRIIVSLAALLGTAPVALAQIAPGKYNNVILDQIRVMPAGGKYSASRAATIRLQSAAHFESGIFSVVPDAASPSYCSGATYLVFIKTIETLRARGALTLDYATSRVCSFAINATAKASGADGTPMARAPRAFSTKWIWAKISTISRRRSPAIS
jgi:hypothetical protein